MHEFGWFLSTECEANNVDPATQAKQQKKARQEDGSRYG